MGVGGRHGQEQLRSPTPARPSEVSGWAGSSLQRREEAAQVSLTATDVLWNL